jgi:hypothetical protein
MKILRTTRLGLAVATALAVAACSDASRDQLAPSAPSLSAGRSGKSSKPVDRDDALQRDITRSVTVTNAGGKIEIPEAGLKVRIPSNALPAGQRSLTITVTAFAGNDYAYEFEPSGTQFRQPLAFEQQLGDASLRSVVRNVLQPPVVAYFKSRQDIDRASGLVVTLEDLLTNLDLSRHAVKAEVWHFSGYVVAWGQR